MPKKVTTEIFIEKAVAKHGNKYDYSESIYTKAKEKLIIKCLIHGTFEQTPDCHIQGSGCTECSYEVLSHERIKSKEEWIKEANQAHNFKYNYDESIYTGSNDLITIRCSIHGLFKQIAFNHLKGHGCNECGNNKIGNALASDLATFNEKANIVHNYRYDYSKSIYISAHKKLEIICPIHGSFFQSPANHLAAKGCSKCNWKGGIGFTKDAFNKQATLNYDGKATLYLIKCNDDNEEFYKVGITLRTVERRFTLEGENKTLPYKYTVLNILEDDASSIYDKEKTIKKLFKKSQYIPLKVFKGMYECYQFTENLSDINDHFRGY